jgi:hypothetical protein
MWASGPHGLWCGAGKEWETIGHQGSTGRELSATKPLDDHAEGHLDIRRRIPRVVLVVSLRLAI